MKGFKPTGYGPSAGFKFPARMGFTGSTGSLTNVSPHVRRKAFANGGFVRQDHPRMKSESVGDSGSALVRRSKPTTQLDQESGGRSPLRPGFNKGGKSRVCKADGGMAGLVRKAITATRSGAGLSNADREFLERNNRGIRGVMSRAGAGVSNADREFLERSNADRELTRGGLSQVLGRHRMTRQKTPPPVRDVKTPSIGIGPKGRFYADGGKIEKPTYWQAVKDRVKELARFESSKDAGLAKKAADKMGVRHQQIQNAVDEAVTGKRKYAQGGKAKRMGYASGGGVTATQAKQIAERTVGDHVRYPAPKGHKGLKA